MGEKKGNKYVCDDYDSPFYVRTVAYVIKHHDRFIGLEFRTDLDELDGAKGDPEII